MSRGYPSDWGRKRKKVYKRDNYTCQNCGRQGGPYGNAELHAHHIVPKSKGGTHKTSNLKTLCKDCHDAIHGRKKAPTAKSNISSNDNFNLSTDAEVTKMGVFVDYIKVTIFCSVFYALWIFYGIIPLAILAGILHTLVTVIILWGVFVKGHEEIVRETSSTKK